MAWQAILGQGIQESANSLRNYFNWGMHWATQAYNRRQVDRQWARDDNAVQRRAADLAAAGIHPTLAAGNPAHSSPAFQADAPPELAAIAATQHIEAIARSQEERKLMEAQRHRTNVEALIHQDLAEKQKLNYDSQTLYNIQHANYMKELKNNTILQGVHQDLQNKILGHDAKFILDSNQRSVPRGFLGTNLQFLDDFASQSKWALGSLFNLGKNMWDWLKENNIGLPFFGRRR